MVRSRRPPRSLRRQHIAAIPRQLHNSHGRMVVTLLVWAVAAGCSPPVVVGLSSAAAATRSVASLRSEAAFTAAYSSGAKVIVLIESAYNIRRQSHVTELRRDDIKMAVELRRVGEEEYYQVTTDGLPRLPWSRIGLPHAETPLAPVDPLVSLDELVTASGSQDAALIGQGEVRGRVATHYRLADASVNMDAWVDGAGRVVRIVRDQRSPGGLTLHTQLEYFAFDQPTYIAPPLTFVEGSANEIAAIVLELFTGVPANGGRHRGCGSPGATLESGGSSPC